MLIRITNYCRMECTHCNVNGSPAGKHMDKDTYLKALNFSIKYDPTIVLLSGGEPSDHPQFIDFVKIAENYRKAGKFLISTVLSNGMFLEDEKLTEEIKKLDIIVQITNDPRFYPKKIKKIEYPYFSYEDHLRSIFPSEKTIKNNLPITRQSPLCFNFRSATFSLHNIKSAIRVLRSVFKMCTPSININGDVVAGEFPNCYKIGTVDSKEEELKNNIMKMKCGRCGLHKNLTGKYATIWEEMESQ